MRRTDHQPVSPNGIPVPGASAAPPTSHLGSLEPWTAAHRFGDLMEEPAASWETAWIDLGGEG
jgi:hypothetical protein